MWTLNNLCRQIETDGHTYRLGQQNGRSGSEQDIDLAYQLYCNVLNHSEIKFEKLGRDFFLLMGKSLDADSFFITARDEHGKLVAFILVVISGNCLLPLYLGMDYSCKDVKSLYLNIVTEAVRIAEKMKLECVVLGQNSYYPKVLSGAILQRCFLGFYATNGTVNSALKYLAKYMFPPFVNNYGTFYKNSAENSLLKFTKDFQIVQLGYSEPKATTKP